MNENLNVAVFGLNLLSGVYYKLQCRIHVEVERSLSTCYRIAGIKSLSVVFFLPVRIDINQKSINCKKKTTTLSLFFN